MIEAACSGPLGVGDDGGEGSGVAMRLDARGRGKTSVPVLPLRSSTTGQQPVACSVPSRISALPYCWTDFGTALVAEEGRGMTDGKQKQGNVERSTTGSILCGCLLFRRIRFLHLFSSSARFPSSPAPGVLPVSHAFSLSSHNHHITPSSSFHPSSPRPLSNGHQRQGKSSRRGGGRGAGRRLGLPHSQETHIRPAHQCAGSI